jgi:flavin reductase (DIM6/NTAB) family NADH-FMN oxidoreductase RutF
MNLTAATLPNGVSEILHADLETMPSSVVAPPRIAGVPAALECKVHSTQEIGCNRLILGIVHRVHVEDGILDREALRIRQEIYHPVGRMGSPHWYCHTADLFEMARPK